MERCYVELRTPNVRGSESGAADMMRHLRTRQHLGTSIVVCDRPDLMLATARKQWMKLSRHIQRQRAMTLNADKILKHTHAIIHMQNMRFTTQAPLADPDAELYFLSAEKTGAPPRCFTVYLHEKLTLDIRRTLVAELPAAALIVDYVHHRSWGRLGVRPKAALEADVTLAWREIRAFLRTRQIDLIALPHAKQHHNIEAMDDALDILLEMPHKFLQAAEEFRHTLELARPMRINRELRLQYDALMLLAHRVQTLTMPAFTQQFLEVYSEDDTFFLYDTGRGYNRRAALLEAARHHRAAGRLRLAHALEMYAAACATGTGSKQQALTASGLLLPRSSPYKVPQPVEFRI